MAGPLKKGGKAKPKAAKSAKPAAKHAAKKLSGGRKITRKAPVKHTTKAKAPAAARGGDDNYLKFSGKFTVRLPKSLHQLLVERAEKEGVSLNLFVTNALSRTVAVPSKKR